MRIHKSALCEYRNKIKTCRKQHVNESIALYHHYRNKCKGSDIGGCPRYRSKILDIGMWKYMFKLDDAVKFAIDRINWSK